MEQRVWRIFLIEFKYVGWKNFLSTGNQFTEVQLDRNNTTLIIGENGAGKSTILDALCFGLFSKLILHIVLIVLYRFVYGSHTFPIIMHFPVYIPIDPSISSHSHPR